MAHIEYDLSGIERLAEDLRGLRDNLAEALPGLLEDIRQTWASAAWGEQLPGMERKVYHPYYRDDLGPAAIDYPADGDSLRGVVRPDRQDIAAMVEHGRPSWDMKPRLLGSPRAKDGKKGRYLSIPLGHGMSKPGMMRPDMTGHVPFGSSAYRTVSDASSANSWIYPAIPGTAVIESVIRAAEPGMTSRVREIIEDWRR